MSFIDHLKKHRIQRIIGKAIDAYLIEEGAGIEQDVRNKLSKLLRGLNEKYRLVVSPETLQPNTPVYEERYSRFESDLPDTIQAAKRLRDCLKILLEAEWGKVTGGVKQFPAREGPIPGVSLDFFEKHVLYVGARDSGDEGAIAKFRERGVAASSVILGNIAMRDTLAEEARNRAAEYETVHEYLSGLVARRGSASAIESVLFTSLQRFRIATVTEGNQAPWSKRLFVRYGVSRDVTSKKYLLHHFEEAVNDRNEPFQKRNFTRLTAEDIAREKGADWVKRNRIMDNTWYWLR